MAGISLRHRHVTRPMTWAEPMAFPGAILNERWRDRLLSALVGLAIVGFPALAICGAVPDQLQELNRSLALAQRNKNVQQVEFLSRELTRVLGAQAGVPDKEARFIRVPNALRALPVQEAKQAFTPVLEFVEKNAWWTKRPQPGDMPGPLRQVASVVEGCLAARRAGCEQPDRLLRAARQAADFLVWAQAQAGNGCFPFPALRGQTNRNGELAERAFARAQANGRLEQVLRNGWFISDAGNGDLQFDNGLAGVAVLRFYQATREKAYLHSACAAADWALEQPAVKNWNYNSFSVFLLAEVYRVTGAPKYLEAAKEKARLGIYPGQLTAGPNRGRWNDPHNARLVYHYILLRGLASLVAALPEGDPDLPRARQALVLGLRVRNAEIVNLGAANPEDVLDVLSRIRLERRLDSLPQDCGIAAAADVVFRLASGHYRHPNGSFPPGAWGLALEALTGGVSAERRHY